MADPIARAPFSGTSDMTKKLDYYATYFVIFNDGNNDLTFTAGSFSGIVKSGDAFDERVDPFNVFTITATDDFRGYVRIDEGGVG